MAVKTRRIKDADEVSWVIDGWLGRKDLMVLTGVGNAGKTTMSLVMQHAMEYGEPFLGFDTTQSRILYVYQDSGPEKLRQMAEELEPDFPGISDISVYDEGVLNWQSIANLELDGKFGVVFIDSLNSCGFKDTNDNAEIGMAFTAWREMAQRENVAVIIVHHESGKSKRSKGYLGATNIYNMCDAMFAIRVQGKRRTIEQLKIRGYDVPTCDITDFVRYEEHRMPQQKFVEKLKLEGYSDQEIRRHVRRVYGTGYAQSVVMCKRADTKRARGKK